MRPCSKLFGILLVLAAVALLISCSGSNNEFYYYNPQIRTTYSLDANASGVIETVNNIVNMTVVSNDSNDLKAEYKAGFIQGKLQGKLILSARDNDWDNAYLTDPGHTFPKQPGPTQSELNEANTLLNNNYNAFLSYLKAPATDSATAHLFKRLLFRMLGIYHGATTAQPANLDFSGAWLPDSSYFKTPELTLGYETSALTFMDVYYINAFNDMMDVIAYSPELSSNNISLVEQPDKCSAFLKRSGGEIFLTHNSWMGFLSQTMTQSIAVNGSLITMNSATPGQIGSSTDFGYNNKGIMFNETTHRNKKMIPKPEGIWIFWRAALAEQFSASIDDFFKYISLDNSGTYLNGYMLVDAKNNESGLVEMSYRCFIYYRSTGGPYSVTAKSLDGGTCSTAYDPEMVTPDYLMGINYPASYQVALDLESTDNRPARKVQFKQFLPAVNSIESSKSLITYTDPTNPLSIFGRWDLGYGQTQYPKTIPDGSVDSKAASASMARAFMGLSGILDLTGGGSSGFWMLYGTPYVNGSPFIWSQSAWRGQKLRDVPDRLDGSFTLMNTYLH